MCAPPQSKKLSPPEVERRTDTFLRLFRGTLLLMPDDEFQSYRRTLAAQFENVDGRLDLQSSRLWTECSLQRYDFERPWGNAAKVGRVTRKQLLDFFDTYVADGSPTRRRLSTHVFSKGMAPSSLVAEKLPDDDLFPPPVDLLVDAAIAV